jgi:alkylhydroperoxidase/carboxymuconolactone decarboxylase family protein YurZ
MREPASVYGYAWAEWLAQQDPDYAKVRQSFSAVSAGEGRDLAIKYREMVMIGILAYRSRQEPVLAHMRRAIAHGATKVELLEALQAAAIPGGAPTLSVGVQALMQLDNEGAFTQG